jgi:alkanesulfonate monooxygenase SsuD/methylene tetrahydromethanopterin reductase-like flavin-dependent oxidoreductase (luciferase family)
MPIQRPIPLWMGGNAEPAVRRIARLADGWFWNYPLHDDSRARLEAFRKYVREAGRDPAKVGVQARVGAAKSDPDAWARAVETFAGMGIDRLEFNTMGAGFSTVDQHIKALQRFLEAAPVAQR